MEDPLISTDFSFSNMRGPWLASAEDDMSGWNEWMHFDPAVASQLPKDIQPSLIHEQPPVFTRRQQSPPEPQPQLLPLSQPPSQQPTQPLSQPLSQPQLMQPTTVPTSAAPMFVHANSVPYSFGQSIDMSPAFDFSGNAISSPLTGEMPPQNAFFTNPVWQQQQPPQLPLQPPPPPQAPQPTPQQPQQPTPPPPAPPPQQLQLPQQFVEPPVFATELFQQPAFNAPSASASTPSLHHSPNHSPSSINNRRASSSSSHSSPEPAARSKKRKARSDDDEPELNMSGKKEKMQPPKKTAHNMIEKRYRTNLNDKIAALRDSVPSLRVMSRPNGTEEDDDPEDLEGLTPAHKLNKATVLSKATEYIRHLEKRAKRLQDELSNAQGRLDNYEKMTMAGQMNLHASHMASEPPRFQEDPFTPPQGGRSMHGSTQGMIPVPENIAALQRGLPPQQHYAHAYPQYVSSGRSTARPPMVTGRRGSTMMGKLMVGSLAGLMVLEGLVEHEQSPGQSDDRGLFALPMHLASVFTPRISFGASTVEIPLAKFFLVLGAFFYLVAPLLFSKPKPQRKPTAHVLLAAAPSIACPVEVRRRAWLAAIQTVWVPQHNFFLEAAALGLKALKLSARKLIGWPGYAFLTGLTKEQEAARIKAWEIALDAQLIGGDAEISRSRLLLTLMASGTLPDTPARLMLKALHIRVLLWEVAYFNYGTLGLVDDLSAKMARYYWNCARSEHRIALNNASDQGVGPPPLPDHLAALIERECDDVLVPSIVQRASNLAWNRLSAENTTVDASMDDIVEDSAICSPLDALAAWYSSLVLKKGLASTLAVRGSLRKESIASDLDTAVLSSPPNSQAQLRALVAQAVLLDDNRTARITSALRALPTIPRRNSGGLIHVVSDGFVATDIRQALTFAKCLSLVDLYLPAARQRAIAAVNNTFLPESTTTLLSFVAGHKVLNRCMQNAVLQREASPGLERIATSLRMWIGHGTGRRSGLSNKVRARLIENCLDTSKTLVGLADRKADAEIDDGYVSSSVKDD